MRTIRHCLIALSFFALAMPNLGSCGELAGIKENTEIPNIGNTQPVKFVVYLNGGRPSRVVMIDPNAHSFHYQYLATTKEFAGATVESIRAISYKKASRKIFLGVLIGGMHTGEGGWDFRTPFQLTTEEIPSMDDLKAIRTLLNDWLEKHSENDKFNNNVAYRPLEEHKAAVRANAAEYEKAGVEIKLVRDESGTRSYTSGWGVGKMQAYKTPEEVAAAVRSGQVTQDTILLLDSDVLELPPVAGVVSAKPLTEASHLVLLAQMYATPLVYQKDAFAKMSSLVGRQVFLRTDLGTEDTYTIVGPLSEEKAAAVKKLKPHFSIGDTTVNWTQTAILPAVRIDAGQVGSYGGKATKFGLIQRTIGEYTQSYAMAIPVSYYRRFLNESKTAAGRKLGDIVAEEYAKLGKDATYTDVVKTADTIRNAMKAAIVPPALISEIRSQLAAYFPKQQKEVRLKIRSSSNVEDGAEFNGAGLYDSEGVCLSQCAKDDFAKGLVKVWSSLYTPKGLWARRQFEVKEENVGMGLLAHPPYKGELANGVARLNHESRCEVLGVLGEKESVTNSENGGGNERVGLQDGRFVEVRPLKGSPENQRMMDDVHYKTICELMQKLRNAWPSPLKKLEIETEWKLTKESKINLKQVRIIPQPKLFNLPSNQTAVITPATWNFDGDWLDDVMSYQFKPDTMKFSANDFTYDDFLKGNVQIKDAQITIRGKQYKLEAAKPTVTEEKYGESTKYELNFALKGAGYPATNLKMSLYLKAPLAVLTQDDIKVRTDQANLISSFNGETSYIHESKGGSYPVRENPDDKCPVRLKWTSVERWVGYDDEVRTMSEANVAGILANRTITLKGVPWAMYHRSLHEGLESFFIDLFADTTLTAPEKAKINELGGRYLHISNSAGKFHLKTSPTDEGKALKDCREEGSSGEEG